MNHYVDISEIIRNYAIILGGFAGIGLAAWRVIAINKQANASIEQAKINRRDHISALFTKAGGLLGDDRLEVRLGAIYTLTGISRDFPEMSNSILELLSTYVRERSAEGNDVEASVDIIEISTFLRESLSDVS